MRISDKFSTFHSLCFSLICEQSQNSIAYWYSCTFVYTPQRESYDDDFIYLTSIIPENRPVRSYFSWWKIFERVLNL